MGKFPIETTDKSMSIALKKALEKKKITFGFDTNQYSKADIVIVSINCDLKSKNKINLKEFVKSFSEIINNIYSNTLILIESTVPPGTCEKLLYPIMKKNLKKRKISLSKVFLAHSFERVTPGNNYLNSCKNTFKVYSGINKSSEKKCYNFLKTIVNFKKYPLIKLKNITSSETCKLMENSYRALNIAFIDEWVKFSENINIDLLSVIKSIKMRDTHKNIMLPGIGVGGYCLTKDPLFTKIASKQIFKLKNMDFPLSTKAVKLNKKMPDTSLEFIKKNVGFSLKKKKILFYGITYKENIGDIRHSPTVDLAKKLRKLKCDVFFYDPLIKVIKDKNIKFYDIKTKKLNFDLKILTVKHKETHSKTFFKKFTSDKGIIFDLNNVLSSDKIALLKKRNSPIFILGR